ncbi:MAG: Obg family GTPase CgtA [Lentisphaerae bacterium]|nr:Obg family GTPase CgtA [Lentisphaerota bacterium]
MKSNKFVETAVAEVLAGAGGNGCCSFRREKFVPRGGPDGGDGGRGGHVLAQADRNVDSLIALHFNPHRQAPAGGHGRGKRQHGRNGRDLIIKVPCGTEIHDEADGSLLGELLEPDQQLLLAGGGKGGLGNCHWKTSTHQAPREFTKGAEGEQKRLRFDLKIMADIGLIGFPNAGKSTLISRISHAHPRIAAYPFTTVNPIIGTVKFDNLYRELRVVDIPGLIPGAHHGAGMGHKFLRHVERARALAIVLDMAGSEGRHPADDYSDLIEELRLYRAELLEEFRTRTGIEPLLISAREGTGLEPLKQAMLEMIQA